MSTAAETIRVQAATIVTLKHHIEELKERLTEAERGRKRAEAAVEKLARRLREKAEEVEAAKEFGRQGKLAVVALAKAEAKAERLAKMLGEYSATDVPNAEIAAIAPASKV